ncbi:PROTEIN CLAVATA 3 [Salix purpurea]|uniref:PROTEIN CLAVATA 3 n=1 Tax=Salix purpurea TaxID=77065 RepID=A0A9Q0VVI4_SALPP|nr:PROTEIN CLAVATA 3 [Salix purpurea]
MACPTKFYSLVLVLVLFFMVVEESNGLDLTLYLSLHGCSTGRRCFFAEAVSPVDVKSRKVLAVLTGGLRRPAGSTGNGEKLEIRELRAAPSGPDPLHHNGGSPKKPRTP